MGLLYRSTQYQLCLSRYLDRLTIFLDFFFETHSLSHSFFFFFLNDPAPPKISPFPLPAPLPIGPGVAAVVMFAGPQASEACAAARHGCAAQRQEAARRGAHRLAEHGHEGGCALIAQGIDRKSTRLNSSHLVISYAVFCLKKKKT